MSRVGDIVAPGSTDEQLRAQGLAARDIEAVRSMERILAGEELVCVRCGCTDSRACEGGCTWASTSPAICSSCDDPPNERST